MVIALIKKKRYLSLTQNETMVRATYSKMCTPQYLILTSLPFSCTGEFSRLKAVIEDGSALGELLPGRPYVHSYFLDKIYSPSFWLSVRNQRYKNV